ncbi:hypothetical protein CHR53_14790 [Neobacillus mesonae]|uniref:Uncharacterized protein n=1 Tax=Neobacillus mesonae TaxID=1193713 RepID=A0A3Q9QST0_9BACI|nr:hypothetical protein CHR53_14790 [Neobacillus mesonae]
MDNNNVDKVDYITIVNHAVVGFEFTDDEEFLRCVIQQSGDYRTTSIRDTANNSEILYAKQSST